MSDRPTLRTVPETVAFLRMAIANESIHTSLIQTAELSALLDIVEAAPASPVPVGDGLVTDEMVGRLHWHHGDLTETRRILEAIAGEITAAHITRLEQEKQALLAIVRRLADDDVTVRFGIIPDAKKVLEGLDNEQTEEGPARENV